MTTDEEELYYKALAYATQKHSGQLRIGGALYITHPIAVAQLVRASGHGLDYQITALFHDLLEDTNATKDEILALSNAEVVKSVVLLTKEDGYDMQTYIDEIRENPMAKVVKAADRLHNLQSALVASQEFRRKYILETLDWYMDFCPEIPKAVRALAQSLTQPMTELSFLYEPVKNMITPENDGSEETTMDNEFTVARAMQAASPEELIALAQENGIVLPLDAARELYNALHESIGPLADHQLDGATGGKAISTTVRCPVCSGKVDPCFTDDLKLKLTCQNQACSHSWVIM